MYVPEFDKGFKPAIIELKEYNKKVEESGLATELTICLERNKGYNYLYHIDIYKDGTGHDEENYNFIERIVKTLLWVVGGYRIYVCGSEYIAEKLKLDYCKTGARAFDSDFMTNVYENEFEVVSCTKNELPELKEEVIKIESKLDGCRIGFDAGGSDRKVSASIDGDVVFTDETVWFPKINSDPQYHYDGIMDSVKRAASYLPRVDSIGVSSAGICVDNKIMVASLFIKVSKEDFDRKAKNIYIDIANEIAKEQGHDVPLVLANDGDVTALAGAMELDDDRVLGIAMGTSEAAGYIGKSGSLKGWLNELAFAPVDFNKNAMVDEWSGDYGCGVKYFSQDGVIKLAEATGITLDESWPPARKLKYLQDLNEQGNEVVDKIFNDIGIYLGYTLAWYAHFYDMKHVLLLGRVVSGKGGNTIISRARRVLYKEFPEMARTILHMPDDKKRRVGQSIAAASLPSIKK